MFGVVFEKDHDGKICGRIRFGVDIFGKGVFWG